VINKPACLQTPAKGDEEVGSVWRFPAPSAEKKNKEVPEELEPRLYPRKLKKRQHILHRKAGESENAPAGNRGKGGKGGRPEGERIMNAMKSVGEKPAQCEATARRQRVWGEERKMSRGRRDRLKGMHWTKTCPTRNSVSKLQQSVGTAGPGGEQR